ncbi:MAG TPA: malate synthase [Thermoanaerobaculia bacterium]|nr:malate synthase [Thermoanaerobaculia bacterium]
MIREDILQAFPELFGSKTVNGRQVDVEQTIAALTRALRPRIAAALNARRALLQSPLPVREKYAWPKWDDSFDDPVSGRPWTFRQILQGLVDNFHGRDTGLRWRLNDSVPPPPDAAPLRNPGLELTGPWHPLDMAFNALNSPAPMNMPDFEDASPPHFRPTGEAANEPIGIFAALRNAKEIHEGRWNGRPYEVVKKEKTRVYTIKKPPGQWPTRFARPPSIHVNYDHVVVAGAPAPGIVAVTVLWTFNNYDALTRAGSGVYFYIPKLQTPAEAFIVETLLSGIEEAIGVAAGTLKVKMLYEEGNAGRYLPAIAWTLRRRLLGTNVGRWDYLGSLIEMWKDDPKGVFPDPQTVGMAAPNMIAYQRYNALMMLMAGMKDGELANGGPIGGMAAVMIYQAGDPYGRSRYNPLALRAMVIDKLRERLLGLMSAGGRLYDVYRQSWVASPEESYVAAGNAPLQASIDDVQRMIDAPVETVDVDGKPVPTVKSGLTDAERRVFESRAVLTAEGKIAPRALTLDAPETIFTPELWESIYSVPQGDVTIEHIQHAFYMAANYGFQILNGNFAAAFDDYELKLRFMNDLATYRIDVSWLWTLVQHRAVITKDGWLKRPALTRDGVEPAENAVEVKAGTPFTPELFQQLWDVHNEWTYAFFAEQDRRGDPGRFDRAKAPVIMEVLKRQLLSPRYIQHSARVLFLIAEAEESVRAELLDAIFDDRIGSDRARAARDYVYDIR